MSRAAQVDKQNSQDRAGVLAGIKVLDLTSYLAGPYGCALLSDLGAEVIKVESPQGDMMRNYPSTLTDASRSFLGANRSKRGIVIDLKNEHGHRAFLDLVKQADVLVHNFRPTVPPRLKIEYERLKEINPRLIYCGITGFGESGPLANNAGFDQVLQCMTGLCTFQGGEGNKPQVVMGSVVDYYTSALVAFGISSALYQRERNGKGQYIGSSLLRSALAMQSGRFIWGESEGREVSRDIHLGKLTGIHPTQSGYLYLSFHSQHFWEALCDFLGLSEFKSDPRFGSMASRSENAEAILPSLHAALADRTAEEWSALFGDKVPNAPVRAIEDMFDHPQVQAQNLVADYEHADIGKYRGLNKPLQFSSSEGAPPFAAPTLGQHTNEVLEDHGFSAADIDELRRCGAVR